MLRGSAGGSHPRTPVQYLRQCDSKFQINFRGLAWLNPSLWPDCLFQEALRRDAELCAEGGGEGAGAAVA